MKIKPNDIVSFTQGKLVKKGRVKEITLWRRENIVACLILEANGQKHWIEGSLVQKVN